MATIKTQNVLHNLNKLEDLYQSTRKQQEKKFYSKLALLEACGWIEETMDAIARKYQSKYIPEMRGTQGNPNYRSVSDKIKKTFSFEYDKFIEMIVAIVGRANVEYIENHISIPLVNAFKTNLNNLKAKRNDFAHTYIVTNSTITHPSPSTTINDLNQIIVHLKNFDNALNRLRFK
jgi:hypothetical protein